MTADLLIFDCDGVLVDSEPIINRAHAAVLAECGYAISEEALVERFCGMSDPEMLAAIEHDRGCPLPLFYAERVGNIIERQFSVALAAMPGIVDVLGSLRSKSCVASSSALGQLRRKLELTGLLPYFGEKLFSAEMVARGKPAPDLLLYAAAKMGVAPGRCLVTEDSPAGIRGARAAGMTAIGFCGGGHCRPGHDTRLRDCGAALVIADMYQLPGVLSRTSAQRTH